MNKSPFLLAAAVSVLLAACGGSDSGAPAAPAAPAAAPAPAPVAAAPAAPANAVGEGVYKKVCALCHAAGVAGAPMPGNKDEWAPRIAQGEETLYKHALEGFTGAKGMMPARGGGTSLSDDEVKAAVDYMVAKSK
ncbi:c-type cytochrome [Thauera aromatica]|uniref:Cytochrome c family protein n=1 Tax=Thauera aromatica K172 TaxID=44139 RepID=A0A2R4BJI2_THAAR|nr:c-type cytochrome [Thauera aromatica]AVR87478.1 cytochrome c family protein [Thauera aromatica K172]